MDSRQVIKLNFLGYLLLSVFVFIAAVAAVLFDENDKHTFEPELAVLKDPGFHDNTIPMIDYEEDAKENATSIKGTFLYSLIRTTFLYLYTVFCIYYIMLMEEKNLLPKHCGFLGRVIVFTTVVGFLLVEVSAPSNNAFVVIVRLGIVLTIFTVVHLIWLVFRSCTREVLDDDEQCSEEMHVIYDGDSVQLINDQEVPDEEYDLCEVVQ